MQKQKPSEAEVVTFVLLGYVVLSTNDKNGEPYRWRHVVYSGFNAAFREFFPKEDPRECLDRLAKAGHIRVNIARGGAVFKPEPELLRQPPQSDPAFVRNVRKHLGGFLVKRAIARPQDSTTKPVEERVKELWEQGQFEKALELLGIESRHPGT